MNLLIILGWLVYGVIVGLIVKAIYKPSGIPSGLFSTLSIGVVGSFFGGFIRYLLTGFGDPFQPSGIIMGILGGLLACFVYEKLKKTQE
jgi:uncharacterized membrane protein YeaQ/YmgE (transglycosylase-associated protein family)